jgi:hypothetical protein
MNLNLLDLHKEESIKQVKIITCNLSNCFFPYRLKHMQYVIDYFFVLSFTQDYHIDIMRQRCFLLYYSVSVLRWMQLNALPDTMNLYRVSELHSRLVLQIILALSYTAGQCYK